MKNLKIAASMIFLFLGINLGYGQSLTAIDSSFQQAHSTAKKSGFKRLGKITIVPALLMGAGVMTMHTGKDQDTDDLFNKYSVRAERNKHFPSFSTHIDNYMQFAPIAVVYGLDLAGVKSKNNIANRTALMLKSEMIMMAITFPLKKLTAVPRPDSGKPNSFPSGHTAQAFAAATFMAKEYRDKSIWYPIGAYTMATGVGVLRVMNDRHWVSDVLAGAGVGIFSTELAYLTHRYKWSKRKNKPNKVTAIPTYTNGPGLYFSCRL